MSCFCTVQRIASVPYSMCYLLCPCPTSVIMHKDKQDCLSLYDFKRIIRCYLVVCTAKAEVCTNKSCNRGLWSDKEPKIKINARSVQSLEAPSYTRL